MGASRSISITYVPADCGSVIPGKSKAPKAFRDVGIVQKLEQAGLSVAEHHALDAPAEYTIAAFSPGNVRNEKTNIHVCECVYRTMLENLSRTGDQIPFQLILGGECCMSPAIMSAFWHHAESQSPPKRVGLIYIDADTDLNTPMDPNSSGNLAGMNMTHLIQSPQGLKA